MGAGANGAPKGGAGTRSNSRIVTSPATRRKPSIARWLLSTVARLCVWYAIFVALFRCPSSLEDLDASASSICKPYLVTRQHIAPYVSPYYDAYLAPYATAAEPYLKTANAEIVQPVLEYAAPHIEQLRSYSQATWDRAVKPQLDAAQVAVKKQYDASLGPQLDKASAAAAPYVEVGKENVISAYNEKVLPAYSASRPYAERTYAAGYKAVMDTGVPYARQAWDVSLGFLTRTLWPRIRILYGSSVEPQLVRITERLARYRDSRRIMSVVEEVERSQSRSQYVAEPTEQPLVEEAIDEPNEPVTPEEPPANKKKRATPESLQKDLNDWKEKFIRAADTAADDLEDRVKELTDRQYSSQIEGVGEALLVTLNQTAATEIYRLRRAIKKIISKLGKEPSEERTGQAVEQVGQTVRTAGLAVKERAQAIRAWKQTFDVETASLVFELADSAVVMMDNIRDLGMQEVGMRWAWTDGVTWRDWKKYHDFRDTLKEWRTEVQEVGIRHDGVARCKAGAEDIEARGMAIAEETASELSRLKEVGIWKIHALDDSDDWSSRAMPAKAVSAAKQVSESVDSLSQKVVGTSQGSIESIYSNAAEQATSIVMEASAKFKGAEPGVAEKVSSKVSEAVLGTPTPVQETIDSIVSKAQEASDAVSDFVLGSNNVLEEASSSAVSVASDIKAAVIGTPPPVGEQIALAAGEYVDNAAASVSEAVLGTETPTYESVASKVSSKVKSALSDASEGIIGSSTPAYESVASEAVAKAKSIASEASTAIIGSSTPGYVSSASVVSSKVESVASEANSRAQSAVSEASKSVIGESTPGYKQAASQAAQKVQSALSDAKEAVIPDSTPAYESIASDASSRLKAAASAASDAVVGSSTPVAESIASAASSVASKASVRVAGGVMAQAVEWTGPVFDDDDSYAEKIQSIMSEAGDRYSEITKAVSEAIESATKTQGTAESVASVASQKYASALEAASIALYGHEEGSVASISSVAASHYSQAVAAASAALYGPPTHVAESMLSAAQEHYSEAVQEIQQQLTRAKSIASEQISGTPEPVHRQIFASIESGYSDSLASAKSQLNSVLSVVAEQVQPTRAPQYQILLDAARDKYSEALSIASSHFESAKSLAGATSKPAYESVLSAASSTFSEASVAASSQLAAATEAASSAAYGPPAGSLESISSVAAYHLSAGLAAASAQFSSVQAALGATPAPAYAQYQAEARRRYYEAIGLAHERYSDFTSAASVAVYGKPTGRLESMMSEASRTLGLFTNAASTALMGTPTPTPWHASIAADASKSWEALVSKASEQVYGTPTPFTASVYSQAGDYAAQATAAAAAQFAAVQELFAELVSGKEPAFTESAMNRLSSAYYTGMPDYLAYASSYANDVYNSASSVLSSAFTPPATLEAVLQAASDQVNAAVDAASVQLFGSSTGTWEKATSAASEAVYGHETGFAEAAQSSIEAIAASASSALSVALYGTTPGAVESAAHAASSAASVVHEEAASAMHAASTAVYGPEQGAMASAAQRLAQAVESARARLAHLASEVGGTADEAVRQAQRSVESAASQVSSVVSEATERARDEL